MNQHVKEKWRYRAHFLLPVALRQGFSENGGFDEVIDTL